MVQINPAFLVSSHEVGELRLCHVRLQADLRFPWLILIPRIEAVDEFEDLARDNRAILMDEIVLAGRAVRAVGKSLGRPVAKLNVGQMGNITPQLHIHVVGRRKDDPAWPGAVWGLDGAEPYDAEALDIALAAARTVLRI